MILGNERGDSPGGGVTNIYAGTGCAIFRVPFFEQRINFERYHFC